MIPNDPARDFFMDLVAHVVISVRLNLISGSAYKTIDVHCFLMWPGKPERLAFKLGELLENSLLEVQAVKRLVID